MVGERLKECGKMGKRTEKGRTLLRTGRCTLESGVIQKSREGGSIMNKTNTLIGAVRFSTKENGKMGRNMEMAHTLMNVAVSTKDNGAMTVVTAKARTHTMTVITTMVNGIMTTSVDTAKESIRTEMVMSTTVNGKTVPGTAQAR